MQRWFLFISIQKIWFKKFKFLNLFSVLFYQFSQFFSKYDKCLFNY